DGSDKKLGSRGFGQSILSLTDPITERRGPYLRGYPDKDACRSALSADGKLAAFTGGALADEIVIWETATGKQLQHLGGKLGTPPPLPRPRSPNGSPGARPVGTRLRRGCTSAI